MKKQYVKPVLYSEEFVANEYIAACWSIKCNVPSGVGYIETNGIDGYQEGSYLQPGDDFIASGSGCGTTHEASGIDASGPSANAMWDPSRGEPYPVFYFKANGGFWNSNHHFCTLDSVNWSPNPNASN